VRAYGPTQVLFDKAMFFSVEYIIPFPGIADKEAFDNHTWGELIQLSFFYDVAFGSLNDPLPSEVASRNYKGAGLSISYNNPGKFSTKFTFANPIGGPFPQNRRSPQFWVDFNYYF
jgi:hemolysin activation/secretion protein